MPDHVKNPEKYTKYSLKDVPEVSNKSNSAAAFDFLQKLKQRNQEEEEPAADLSQKIVFKKKEKKIPKINEEQSEASLPNASEEKPAANKKAAAKAAKLEKDLAALQNLLDIGRITPAEYDEKKAKAVAK